MTPHIAAAWLIPALLGAFGAPAGTQPAEPVPVSAAQWVQRTLQRDATLAAQREEVRGSEAAEGIHAAAWRPQLQLSTERGRIDRADRLAPDATPAAGGSLPTDRQSLTLSQLLYDGQRNHHEAQAANLRTQQQRVRLDQVGNDRALEVLTAWHEWRGAHRAWRVHQQAEQQLQALVERVRQRLQAGQAAEVDLRRIESRWADGQRASAEAHHQWLDTAVRLRSLSGVEAPDPDTTAPAFEPLDGTLLDSLRERCRTECAQVRESALQRDRGQAEWAAARAGYLPRVTLEASEVRTRNATGVAEHYRNRSLMVKLSWTLSDGGERRAQVRQIGHSVQALELRRQDSEREALQGVDQALLRYRDALVQYTLSERSHHLAQEALRLTLLGMEAARRQPIEYADVVSEAASAAQALAQRDTQRWIARDGLLAHSGVLLEHLRVPPP